MPDSGSSRHGKVDRPEIMFVGEFPGEEEDLQGVPMVGKAGKLFDKMVDAMGFVREEVFVADALKCFPKERVPSAEEYEACRAYLCQQIDFIQPKVVVAMVRLH